MTPVLWGRATSVNVQKVMWALGECDIAHERIDAGGRHGRTDTPEFRAMAPLGRVPVWQDGNLNLWESHAILRHLGRGPAGALWPDAPEARARVDQWMEFTTSTLLPPFIGVFYQVFRLPERERSAEALAAQSAELNRALDILEAELGRSDWLAGPDLTLADICAGAPMYRYHTIDVVRTERPALSKWYSRLTERAAYRQAVMTSYDDLRLP